MGVTLTEFILLGIADDERAWAVLAMETAGVEPPIYGPARAMAECEAKRRIVELHAIDCWVGTGPDGDDEYFCTGCAGAGTAGTPDGVVCPTLAALATVYADRPGYLDEWRAP